MNILITGSTGQLGKALIRTKPSYIFEEPINLITSTRKDFDLLNPSLCKSKIIEINPDWIINTAAYTQVDKAEKEKDLAFLTNAYAPKAIAEGIKKGKGKMIQISTDFVFNGAKYIAYEPHDDRNPLQVYGKSKALGEKAVETLLFPLNKAKILRTSWVMSPFSNNFALTMLKLHNSFDTIKVIDDQFGCLTSAFTLATTCWQIIKKDLQHQKIQDILHCCDKGTTNWYEIACKIGEFGKKIGIIDKPAKVQPIKSIEWNSAAKRPAYSVLDVEISFRDLEQRQIGWGKSLESILKEIKSCQSI